MDYVNWKSTEQPNCMQPIHPYIKPYRQLLYSQSCYHGPLPSQSLLPILKLLQIPLCCKSSRLQQYHLFFFLCGFLTFKAAVLFSLGNAYFPLQYIPLLLYFPPFWQYLAVLYFALLFLLSNHLFLFFIFLFFHALLPSTSFFQPSHPHISSSIPQHGPSKTLW